MEVPIGPQGFVTGVGVQRKARYLSAFVAVMVGVGGCGSGSQKHRLGEFCLDDAQFESGLCYDSKCLDPDGDVDGDGLKNGVEKGWLSTNPIKSDTDGDGSLDREEVGTSIERPNDSDNDGKIDAIESAVSDRDHDCLPDQFDANDDMPDQPTNDELVLACAWVGVCKDGAAAVQASCTAGKLVCDHSAVPGWEAKETSCDGKDNDCNGVVDDAPACCVPSCSGRECGDDGCGGSCGECASGQVCGAGGACMQSDETLADNHDGTVTDSESRQTWARSPSPDYLDYDAAVAWCDALTTGGLDGWRVPSVDELRSLIRGCSDTATGGSCPIHDSCTQECPSSCDGCTEDEGPGFLGTYSSPVLSGARVNLWTSTPVGRFPGARYVIGFVSATITFVMESDGDESDIMVRCIR